MLKIAICEDNAIHAKTIRGIIEKELSIPFQIYMFSKGKELMDSCFKNSYNYDIICMDISLDKDSESGIQFAKKINSLNAFTQLIFISQYLEYASSVYETEHIYFVYKGKIDIYLKKALEKAVKNLEDQKQEYLEFDFNRIHYRILQKDILYLERNLRTTYIHTVDKTIYSTATKLQDFQKKLLPFFCPCHRSFLVNLHAVKTINRSCAILSDGTEIPVARNYYPEIKKNFLML